MTDMNENMHNELQLIIKFHQQAKEGKKYNTNQENNMKISQYVCIQAARKKKNFIHRKNEILFIIILLNKNIRYGNNGLWQQQYRLHDRNGH